MGHLEFPGLRPHVLCDQWAQRRVRCVRMRGAARAPRVPGLKADHYHVVMSTKTPLQKTIERLRSLEFVVTTLEGGDLAHVANVLAIHPAQRELVLVRSVSKAGRLAALGSAVHTPALRSSLAFGSFEVSTWDGRGLDRRPINLQDLPATLARVPAFRDEDSAEEETEPDAAERKARRRAWRPSR
jgi:hypothetical protein